MEIKTVEEINQYSGSAVNPLDAPDLVYELYSVPSFESQYPEIVKGSAIGSSKITVEEGDVLVCKINPRINRVWVVRRHTSYPLLASSEWIVIRNRDIDSDYLKWYFSSPTFRNLLVSQVAGIGGSLTRAQPKQVAKYPVPLVEKEEQRRIAAVLDKVSGLIAKRRAQLDKLDLLVKSRFVEMFGDPVSNTLGWRHAILREATSKIGSGATPRGGKESYQSEGITLIRSMNVHDRRFEYKDLAHITDTQAAQLDNVIVEENDVFINITGASVARSCIVPSDVLPARVNQHVAIVRCIPNLLHPIFANCMFLNDRFKRKLLDIGESGGATRQAITKQQLETLTVILPSLELQQQFVAFVEQTEKTKTAISYSLDKLETLKKALMQQYFG